MNELDGCEAKRRSVNFEEWNESVLSRPAVVLSPRRSKMKRDIRIEVNLCDVSTIG